MQLTKFKIPLSDDNQKALLYYNGYRLLLVFMFLGMLWLIKLPEPLGTHDQRMFTITVHVYFLLIMLSLLVVQTQQIPFVLQVILHFVVDIVCISVMMFASEGINSGFGMLMVVTIAACSLLSSYKLSLFFAAICSLVVLSQEIYLDLFRVYPQPNYPHAGFLGVTFFATALIAYKLASRLEQSELLTIRQAEDIENLASLNDHIVQNLQSGVIVIDKNRQLRLINQAGMRLLDKSDIRTGDHLSNISQSLSLVIEQWQLRPSSDSIELEGFDHTLDVHASIRQLGSSRESNLLIFLYDSSRMRREAQSLKLASLGRLTASIAHEVRNPLGAISHASQLLSESQDITDSDKRLTDIINEHSHRVNQIIENVMSVSRMDVPDKEKIRLNEWLYHFVSNFADQFAITRNRIYYEINPQDLEVFIDSSQLDQVMRNLCENAIRYSRKHELINIFCHINADTQEPYIDVCDTGPGIPVDVREHLFEPFFTTENTGSGLGLYLAREMCEINQAKLQLLSSHSEGSCFRISFPPIETASQIQ